MDRWLRTGGVRGFPIRHWSTRESVWNHCTATIVRSFSLLQANGRLVIELTAVGSFRCSCSWRAFGSSSLAHRGESNKVRARNQAIKIIEGQSVFGGNVLESTRTLCNK
jgi:hypothetical protein